ncbi:MAG: hypothetical protein HY898_02210 [Deltaproteobacteria bacterium]|nr:hypothetical protein [Deltaproteobacteria bacterium]
MNSNLTSLALFGLASILGGCAVGVADTTPEDPTESADSELSTTSRSYVTLRHDDRKCMSPMCGGYWVKDANKNTAERYVSGLDFGPSNLDSIQVGKVLEAAPEELVLRGKLTKKDPTYGTQAFLVYEAYRGMPGVVASSNDFFYRSEDRNPQIQCFAAPCPNETATRLNTSSKTNFDRFNFEHATKLFVDSAWLVERVDHHNAIVAGRIFNGQKFPGGYEKVLDASQVYVRIDDMTGPCPAFKLSACPDGEDWAYTRDADMCLIPDKCVPTAGCPSLQPPMCEEGYSVSGWRIDSKKCMQLVCDPTFVAQ